MNENSASNKIFELTSNSRCYNCDLMLPPGSLVRSMKVSNDQNREIRCLACAGLADYDFLPSGNTRLTRLAKKISSSSFVVMRWSLLWKTHERTGILVEKKALRKAKEELQII